MFHRSIRGAWCFLLWGKVIRGHWTELYVCRFETTYMQISIFVHEIDKKQNEVAPEWFKIEEFCAALSNKYHSKHWKTGEMFHKSH